ncbi:MAG: F0F1 ATP synthase subunit gamma [Pseudomonadota bacterium]|nr:F0F1 ATP synthase subunit gamma [Pseudomonadota bacterium]
MPSLKDLRNRIDTVKSTRKITQAMKMVAASKLKKAQNVAEKGRNYSAGIEDIVKKLIQSEEFLNHPLIGGSKDNSNKKTLIIVVSSDRGLCGGLNTNIIKKSRFLIKKLTEQNKNITIICIGKKGYDALYTHNKESFSFPIKCLEISDVNYVDIQNMGDNIIDEFKNGNFDECYVLYNFFKSVISQEVKEEKLLPYEKTNYRVSESDNEVFFDFEPNVEDVLSKILPKNFVVQIYKSVLESKASEQGARMTAMDNATRNAGEMIDNLSLRYNRQRQAMITKELIEIISGAEAL